MKKFVIVLISILCNLCIYAQEPDFNTALSNAQQGDIDSQAWVGHFYYAGKGVAQDYTQAVYWYRKAAEQGSAYAQMMLGYCYMYGRGVAFDDKQAFYWSKKAVENGQVEAQELLGCCYYHGLGVAQDYQQALSLCKNPAEQNSMLSQFLIGEIYLYGAGVQRDEKLGASWLQKAANNGFPDAMMELAKCYYSGTGVQMDSQQAVYWMEKAAENDVSFAQFGIGMTYLEGSDVNKDEQKALYWLKKAAENNCVEAQVVLSYLYNEGKIVQQDYQRAVYWLEKAAEQNSHIAKLSLAIFYATGEGVQKDEKKALDYITQAEEVVKMEPSNNTYDYLALKGQAYLALNDMAKAQEVWKELQEKYPNEVKELLAQDGEVFAHTMNGSSATIDMGIPTTTQQNVNTFAFIIANESYRRVEPVPFAQNDGKIFAEYCQKTLGVPEKNLHLLQDATLGDIKYQVSQMKQIADAFDGDAKFIFYYAGHGLPAENQQDAFLIPVDGYGADGTGYSVNELYNELGALNAKSIVVLLDACFSGAKRDGGMIASARGVAIKTKQAAPKGNMVILSAAQGDETAYPYKEHGHGLFTYFLLKKLNESKGDVTLGELADYITSNVKKTSIVENGKLQTPAISVSPLMESIWREIKLK